MTFATFLKRTSRFLTAWSDALNETRANNKRTLNDDDVSGFKAAAGERPYSRSGHSDHTGLQKDMRSDPVRMFFFRRDLKWLAKKCDKYGIPYREVEWWNL